MLKHISNVFHHSAPINLFRELTRINQECNTRYGQTFNTNPTKTRCGSFGRVLGFGWVNELSEGYVSDPSHEDRFFWWAWSRKWGLHVYAQQLLLTQTTRIRNNQVNVDHSLPEHVGSWDWCHSLRLVCKTIHSSAKLNTVWKTKLRETHRFLIFYLF